MLYQLYETQRSFMEPFADLAQAASKLYSNPLNPASQMPIAQRVSAGYALMHRLVKDYVKPEFGIRTVEVDGVDSGRICVAALNSKNIDYVARAIAAVS